MTAESRAEAVACARSGCRHVLAWHGPGGCTWPSGCRCEDFAAPVRIPPNGHDITGEAGIGIHPVTYRTLKRSSSAVRYPHAHRAPETAVPAIRDPQALQEVKADAGTGLADLLPSIRGRERTTPPPRFVSTPLGLVLAGLAALELAILVALLQVLVELQAVTR